MDDFYEAVNSDSHPYSRVAAVASKKSPTMALCNCKEVLMLQLRRRGSEATA